MLTNSINNNTATGAASDVIATSAPASEHADMFTKLLVAQIRNQDPLSPSDPSQFVNQLSQLSQTEALQSLAKMNSASASVLQSLQVLAMGAQVGSEVMVETSSVQLDGKPVSGAARLESASAATELVLTGVDGVQHKLSLGSRGAGIVPFSIDPVALGLPPGKYNLQVKTSNNQLPAIEIGGRLDAVRMSAGGMILKVANIGEVAPASIIAFNGKPSATLAAAPSTAI